MAWTAPATATVGQILTAAFMNAQLRDNMLQTAPALVTTLGDIVVTTAANTLKRLAAFTAGDVGKHEIGMLEADVSAYDGLPLIDGGATTNLKYSLDEVDAPDTNDDITDGWVVGSLWVDVTGDKAYLCLDNTDTAAVWFDITQASSAIDQASQAEVEGESNVDKYVPPDLLYFGPSACPAWVVIDAGGADQISYHVSSIGDTGTGDRDVNWSVTFSDAGGDYCITDGLYKSEGVTGDYFEYLLTGTDLNILAKDSSNAAKDVGSGQQVFGDT